MARQGQAGPALATAALGSFFAGTVATFILALAAPPLARAALNFGAPEYFSLIVLGLIASIALAHGSILKALAMIVLGLLLGMVGQDIYTGTPRFTFGFFELYSGINFVSVAVGVFGVAEILRNLEHEAEREVMVKRVSNLWLTREQFRRITAPVLRGTALGSVLGVLPGGGHVLSSFASYSMEKKLSSHPQDFGRGAIEGVAGPESANNAAAQTSFIPMLTLGIPAHPVMALMIGAFIIQGITPGPNVITDEPELFWGIIVSMWVGNLMLVLLNLPLIGLWVRLLTVPYRVLFPAIVVFASLGCYAINGNTFDVYAIAVFGVIGYVLIKLGCEPAPLAARLRARSAARGAPAPGDDPVARRPDDLHRTPDLGDAAGARGDRHHRLRPAGGPQEARRGLRRGGLIRPSSTRGAPPEHPCTDGAPTPGHTHPGPELGTRACRRDPATGRGTERTARGASSPRVASFAGAPCDACHRADEREPRARWQRAGRRSRRPCAAPSCFPSSTRRSAIASFPPPVPVPGAPARRSSSWTIRAPR